MNKKFIYQENETHLVKNNDISCKNCIFAYSDRVIDCIKYQQKPLKIFKGESCEKKQELKVD